MSVESPSEDLLRRFASEIAGAADAMSVGAAQTGAEPFEVPARPLRRLHEQAERYLRVANAPRARFLLFFLSSFFEDVFYNLVGDLPYGEESERCRQQFFANLAEHLQNLSSAIESKDAEQWLDASGRMVSAYFETLTRINDLLDQKE